jgi:hypothetical protein
MTDTQAPERADYRRAAALMLHQYRGDTLGWNEVMCEADGLGRTGWAACPRWCWP